MRIIGGKDYYDSVLAYGRDTDIVFARNKIGDSSTNLRGEFERAGLIIPPRRLPFDLIDKKTKTELSQYRSYRGISIIFCGKMYNGVRIDSFRGGKLAVHAVFSADALHDVAEKLELDIVERPLFGEHIVISRSNGKKSVFDRVFTVDDLTQNKSVLNFLIDNKIVTAVLHREPFGSATSDYWSINQPELGDFQFYRVFDAFSAFQEISMYVGNLPKSGPEMINVSDKVKLEKRGFDETSFRKPPEKK